MKLSKECLEYLNKVNEVVKDPEKFNPVNSVESTVNNLKTYLDDDRYKEYHELIQAIVLVMTSEEFSTKTFKEDVLNLFNIKENNTPVPGIPIPTQETKVEEVEENTEEEVEEVKEDNTEKVEEEAEEEEVEEVENTKEVKETITVSNKDTKAEPKVVPINKTADVVIEATPTETEDANEEAELAVAVQLSENAEEAADIIDIIDNMEEYLNENNVDIKSIEDLINIVYPTNTVDKQLISFLKERGSSNNKVTKDINSFFNTNYHYRINKRVTVSVNMLKALFEAFRLLAVKTANTDE